MRNLVIPIKDMEELIIQYNALVYASAKDRTSRGLQDFIKYAAVSGALTSLLKKYRNDKD